MNLPLRRFRSSPSAEPGGTGPPRRSWWEFLVPPLNPRDLIRHNAGLKLVSLICAVFVWATINVSERDAERVLEVPISLRKVERGLVVTNPPVKPVSVVVRGPRTILDGINERETRMTLDLTGYQPGEARIELNTGMLRPELKRHVKGVRVEPARIKVTLERLARRTLPVRADLGGMPAFGLTVASSQVEPAQVEVTGPASRLDDLKEVVTEPVDLRGEQELSAKRKVPLVSAGDFVNFSPDEVTVTIALEEVTMSREFHRAEVKILNAEGAVVEPGGAVEVTIRGPQRVLHNFKLEDGMVYIDAAGQAPGKRRLDVHVDVPAPLEVVRRTPDKLNVMIPGGGH